MVAATPSRTLFSSVTSMGRNRASPPAARMRSTFFSPLSTERPLRTTLAPSAANISAMVRPMPRVEPVISATLPSSLMTASSRSGGAWRQPVLLPERDHLAPEPGSERSLLVGGGPAGGDGVERDVLDGVGVVAEAVGDRLVVVTDGRAHHAGIVRVDRDHHSGFPLARERVVGDVFDHVGDHHVADRAHGERDPGLGDASRQRGIVEQAEAVVDALAAEVVERGGDVVGGTVLTGVERAVQPELGGP